MGGWEIAEVAIVAGLREVWSVLGGACEPPIWERMEGYGACLAKMAGLAPTLAVENDGKIAGDLSFCDNDAEARRAVITQVMTALELRGRGVGVKLLAECVRQGMEALSLEVCRSKAGSRRLYER